MTSLTPRQIVAELDRYIVGQLDAKRAVAVALRNRWRRMQLDADLQEEVLPKNILMIGPTGVGKTEIARRLAKLANAPFIKVEATKFTEVGYVGRDVDSIIRDLMDVAVKLTREEALTKVRERADMAAKERILNVLIPEPELTPKAETDEVRLEEKIENQSAAKKVFRKKLDAGELDEKEIEIDLSHNAIGVEIMAPPGMEEMTNQLQNIFQSLSSDRVRKRKLRVKDALKLLREEEASKLINDEDIKTRALERVEQAGIVFLDEIDKVASKGWAGGPDVSREGVQRDILPIVEGSTVMTKYGPVRTDFMLFIAAGAFHVSKPSDLIPELQGRFPIRVELHSLSEDDFRQILTEPANALLKQYIALLSAEGVEIEFNSEAIGEIAAMARQLNEEMENIGARRLHTILERVLDDLSFNAPELPGQKILITAQYVREKLQAIIGNSDLSRYIL